MKYGKIIVIAGAIACGNTQSSQTPNPAAAECVVHRTAKQLECVDLFDTKLEINACRDKVKAEIDCTKDGGSDGSAD